MFPLVILPVIFPVALPPIEVALSVCAKEGRNKTNEDRNAIALTTVTRRIFVVDSMAFFCNMGYIKNLLLVPD
jgi:hypothetical protein